MRAGRPWNAIRSRGRADPAAEALVVGELLEHGAVGRVDVGRVARQRDPAERALALAEQRPHVGGHEARVVERALEAAELRLRAQRVAVVEDLGAAVLEADHRGAVRGHRGARAAHVLVGVLGPQALGLLERHAVGDVAAERVVRARLVGDDVGLEAGLEQRASAPRRRCPRSPTLSARPLGARRRGSARPRRRGRRPARRGSASPGAAGCGARRPRRTAPRRRSSSPPAAARRPSRRAPRSA